MKCPIGVRRTSKFKNILITPGVVFVSKIAPALNASPNPVPAGAGMGKTTISWNTGDESAGRGCVSDNGREESLFAAAGRGSAAAPWIRTGCRYEFWIYISDHTALIA